MCWLITKCHIPRNNQQTFSFPLLKCRFRRACCFNLTNWSWEIPPRSLRCLFVFTNLNLTIIIIKNNPRSTIREILWAHWDKCHIRRSNYVTFSFPINCLRKTFDTNLEYWRRFFENCFVFSVFLFVFLTRYWEIVRIWWCSI